MSNNAREPFTLGLLHQRAEVDGEPDEAIDKSFFRRRSTPYMLPVLPAAGAPAAPVKVRECRMALPVSSPRPIVPTVSFTTIVHVVEDAINLREAYFDDLEIWRRRARAIVKIAATTAILLAFPLDPSPRCRTISLKVALLRLRTQ